MALKMGKRYLGIVAGAIALLVVIRTDSFADGFLYLAAVIYLMLILLPIGWVEKSIQLIVWTMIVVLGAFYRYDYGVGSVLGMDRLDEFMIQHKVIDALIGSAGNMIGLLCIIIVEIIFLILIYRGAFQLKKKQAYYEMMMVGGIGTHFLVAFILGVLKIFTNLYSEIQSIPFFSFGESMILFHILEICLVHIAMRSCEE